VIGNIYENPELLNELKTKERSADVVHTDRLATETDNRACPVSAMRCEHYRYQRIWMNGDVDIEYCAHAGNPNDVEGNCTRELCPLKPTCGCHGRIRPGVMCGYVKMKDRGCGSDDTCEHQLYPNIDTDNQTP